MRTKQEKHYRRHKQIRAKVKGTKDRPRLSVFRSNQHIYVQLIDDNQGKTLVSINDLKIKKKKGLTGIKIAKQLGQLIAKEALLKKIKQVVFDRGGYKYHGRVKAIAEGARDGGLSF